MLILAVDSTALTASAALCRDTEPLAAFHIKNGNTHSETLLPMVENLLRCTGISIDEIDLFATSVGPGSFTGVRIGTATVKGLAFGKNKPCAGVSTLEALAENLIPYGGILAPVMNARRGQVYNALFCVRENGLQRLTPDRAISIAELETELLANNAPVTLCGDGAQMTKDGFSTLNAALAPALLLDQNAVSVAKCAYRMAIEGRTVSDAQLLPVYLRMPQAERERLAKQMQKQ